MSINLMYKRDIANVGDHLPFQLVLAVPALSRAAQTQMNLRQPSQVHHNIMVLCISI